MNESVGVSAGRWPLDLCRSLSWITWGIFVVDILVRLFLADERLRYVSVTH
jgi:hypothetical protein